MQYPSTSNAFYVKINSNPKTSVPAYCALKQVVKKGHFHD